MERRSYAAGAHEIGVFSQLPIPTSPRKRKSTFALGSVLFRMALGPIRTASCAQARMACLPAKSKALFTHGAFTSQTNFLPVRTRGQQYERRPAWLLALHIRVSVACGSTAFRNLVFEPAPTSGFVFTIGLMRFLGFQLSLCRYKLHKKVPRPSLGEASLQEPKIR